MTATGVISALIIGIIVGTLGRLILPGRQSIGAIATVAVGIGAALLGTFAARRLDIDNKAPASWDVLGRHLHWSWAELGVQVGLAVILVAIAAALTNTAIADGYRQRRRARTR
jgi:uncharacterized membrane protein YeaQ/YmgE (transglycosylase-associated protein family)